MGERKITDRQLRHLDAWEKFLESQLGCYPASVAAIKLGMTTSGVFNASERGWITFFQIGRDRWYGRRDVITYRTSVSRKFKDNKILPSSNPRNFSLWSKEDYEATS